MKQAQKLYIPLLFLVLALLIVACDEGEDTDQAPDSPTPAEQEAVAEPTAEPASEEPQTEIVEPTEEEVAQEEAPPEEKAAPEEETASSEAVIVQPPPMDDPNLMPVEQFEMFVDDLPVEGWGKTIAAGAALDPGVGPSNNGFPPFIFIDFSSPGDAIIPDPKAIFTMDVPQGRVFAVAPYLVMYDEGGKEYAQEAVSSLQKILDERPENLDEKLLTLPGFGDSQQGVRGEPTYIDFQGGTGVGFVAGYGQEIGPLLNDTLVYQFVGLTDTHSDTPYGTQYISFVFPLEANFLSDLNNVSDEEIAAAEADLESYLAEKTEQINNAADSDFTPELNALNAAMETISTGAQEAVEESAAEAPDESGDAEVEELPGFPIPEPDYNSKLVRDFTPFQEALDGFSPERAAEMDDLLSERNIPEIQEMMDAGQFDAVELVTYYLARIQQYDVDRLNSVMELNPEALEIAAQLDEERAAGNVRGSMHGIPVLLKANIATGDQMKTTAGAVAMQDWQPQRDAFLVKQLRDAGAIIFGKANLSEWANYMDENLPDGFTALGGQTRAAYGPYDPYGSSTGSAVSVAANLTAASIGTETSGSIISPSTVNGVVGLKTSRGLVSRDYIIPLIDWMDVPGPMGRSVTDVAVLLSAMTGTDENDPETLDAEELAGTDFTQFLSLEEAQKLRVGIIGPSEDFLQPIIDSAEEAAGRELTPEETAAARAQITDTLGDPQQIAEVLTTQGIDTVIIDFQEVSLAGVSMPPIEYGFLDSFNNFMTDLGDNAPHASVADLVAFNNEDMNNRAPYGQGYLEASANTSMTAEEYQSLKENNMLNSAEGLRAIFRENDVDVIIFRDFTYAPAGFPALSVPNGFSSQGVPVSALMIGDYLAEPQLLAVGYAFEQGSPPRVAPDLEARMEQIAPVVSSATISSETAESQEPVMEGTDPLVADVWSWSSYADPVDGPLDIPAAAELYSLEFLPDGRVIIVAGCNNANGAYSKEDGSLSIDPGPSTLAECGPDSLSERFISLISEAANYSIEDSKLLIDLTADAGTMEFDGVPVMEMGDQLSSIASMGIEISAEGETAPTSAEELADSALQNLVVREGDIPLVDFAKAPGAVVLVDTPDGRILKADGLASVEEQTPMQTGDRLEIGSNSKMFAGVLLAQLQEEGVLSVDDQLSLWLPEIAAQLPNGDDMTLRQLATHTAGVWDYGNSIIGGGVVSPDLLVKDYTPQEIVDFTIEYGHPTFTPGEEGRWKYSNTGFILLGMVIEAATGQAYGDLLQERIFEPLQMNDSSFLESVPEAGSIVNGYFTYPFAVNTTNWNGSQGWAAGSIVSTAEDMAKFAAALMHGELFQDPQTLALMTDFIEAADDAEVANVGGTGYGLGLIEFAPGLWGHRGQTAGFTSIIAIDPEQDFVFIALTNSAEGAVSLEQDPIGHFLGIEIVGEE